MVGTYVKGLAPGALLNNGLDYADTIVEVDEVDGRLAVANIPLIEARAASVVQMDEVVIGDGACLSPFVTLTVNRH